MSPLLFAVLLAATVFASRALFTAPVYFVDGPAILAAIRARTYVVQPPGYWLLARTAAMFSRPEAGLAILNWTFSALGAVAFYRLATRFCSENRARAAAAVYSTAFFVWFSGCVHSSYASQLLFAPLLVLCFARYAERKSLLRLAVIPIVFAVGSGYRPSDGVFLLPLFMFLTFRSVRTVAARACVAFAAGTLCLAWYLPTRAALRGATVAAQLAPLASQMSFAVAGATAASLSNVLRVVVPLVASGAVLIPLLRVRRDHLPVLLLWVAPGLVFFVVVYMADPTYLAFAAGGIVLLAASARHRAVGRALIAAALLNAGVFLFARPIPGSDVVSLVVNYYAVKYTRFGLEHRWSQNVTEALRDGPWYDR